MSSTPPKIRTDDPSLLARTKDSCSSFLLQEHNTIRRKPNTLVALKKSRRSQTQALFAGFYSPTSSRVPSLLLKNSSESDLSKIIFNRNPSSKGSMDLLSNPQNTMVRVSSAMSIAGYCPKQQPELSEYSTQVSSQQHAHVQMKMQIRNLTAERNQQAETIKRLQAEKSQLLKVTEEKVSKIVFLRKQIDRAQDRVLQLEEESFIEKMRLMEVQDDLQNMYEGSQNEAKRLVLENEKLKKVMAETQKKVKNLQSLNWMQKCQFRREIELISRKLQKSQKELRENRFSRYSAEEDSDCIVELSP